ncbi:MAG: ATP-binding protein [Chloroflexi bacterium]|nr:MAG: ATP-binding protein [Chloroflexota bacterium]
MAKSNRERVGDVMDALRAGLGPFILREYKYVYRAADYLQQIEAALSSKSYTLPPLRTEEDALYEIDVQGWLQLMIYNWREVFSQKLGHVQRSYVSELLNARNDYAHQRPFLTEDAARVADTAERLLADVGATEEANICRNIRDELRRLVFDAQAKKSVKAQKSSPKSSTETITTLEGLKPWRLVVRPHPDVEGNRYIQAEFAADLAAVVRGTASLEYSDPKEFFRRTYLTEGLLNLLVTGAKRLSGQGGDPVVQLQTNFGGGKTHSMLAMYHLFSGAIGFSEIPNGEKILERVGNIDDRIEARRAVIVGTDFSATSPRTHAECKTHTLWGELAYQLGGIDAYRLVETADQSGVSPGAETLLKILEQFGPALIIIDELVAYARNLYNIPDRLPAGSFETIMTFMQSLTEAVKRSSDSIMLISMPASDIEIGGEGGKIVLETLENIVGRIESIWKPVTAVESFEIVRRRLFSDQVDYAARDAVINAFFELYRDNKNEFPLGVSEEEYRQRMSNMYPIHPELFARLYEDWSTLDRFQRTRGVLRLMAAVIHHLWEEEDQSLMIMPSSIPLSAGTVRNEVLRYLPEGWPAIIDSDIDGEDSRPYKLDQENPNLQKYRACQRVARTIFMGSAPATGISGRGLETGRIRLGTVQPGEPIAIFNDALGRMTNQLNYLYNDGSRYWYDTRPTVNRIAQERAQNMAVDLVYGEAIRRLRAVRYRGDVFAAVHIAPQSSGDVPDIPEARVVVLPPEYVHRRTQSDNTKAIEAARDILENRGNMQRLYRNMLVFIAPDASKAEAWEQSIREYLAWKSIDDEKEALNLDAHQQRQVADNLKRNNETVELRLQEAYSWLIVPKQRRSVENGTVDPIEYESHSISGDANFLDRVATRVRQDHLILQLSPDVLLQEIGDLLWKDGPHISIKRLWDYLASYCYLPRLKNQDVFLKTVRDGATRPDPAFGYATMFTNGAYKGLVFGQPSSEIYLDEHAVLVHPEEAKKYLEKVRPADLEQLQARAAASEATASSRVVEVAKPRLVTKYYGSVELNPQRINREISLIVEEIIERLTQLPDTEVKVTLYIEAQKPDGFDEAMVRTIKENSRTLKFSTYDLE